MEHFWCKNETRSYTDSQESSWHRLGGSHHLPPYNIICDWPHGLHPNVIFPRTPKLGILKFPKMETPAILEAHNFLCKLSIDARSKAKLYLSSRTFQWYMACHLHARNSRQFLIFSGQKSNWHLIFDLSFGHNFCCKYSNGSCKPILGIYVSRAFQWSKELFNEFWPSNCF